MFNVRKRKRMVNSSYQIFLHNLVVKDDVMTIDYEENDYQSPFHFIINLEANQKL